jgi:hypothetical protein
VDCCFSELSHLNIAHNIGYVQNTYHDDTKK